MPILKYSNKLKCVVLVYDADEEEPDCLNCIHVCDDCDTVCDQCGPQYWWQNYLRIKKADDKYQKLANDLYNPEEDF